MIPPSCPKNSRGSRFEGCRAAQKSEAAVQKEQENAMNSGILDRWDTKFKKTETLRFSQLPDFMVFPKSIRKIYLLELSCHL